jgi:hypothetical protein
VLETAPIDLRPGLYTGIDLCRNSNRTSTAPDLDPWGVCAPPWTLNAPQKIPPSESAAIWLKTIVSSNDEMGQKGLAGFSLEHFTCNAKRLSGMTAPKLAGWIDLQDSTVGI